MTEREVVKDIMAMRGWSQSKLAEEVGGWKQTNITGLLNNTKNGMRIDNLLKMVSALGCDLIVRDKMGSGREWKISN